jgi:HEAT repeat protein
MEKPDLVQDLLDAITTGDDVATERAAQACAGQIALLPALRPLLAAADANRRWWAVRTLALIGGEEALPLLVERLADEDEATRCVAALGLGQLHEEPAALATIPALCAILADPSGWVRDSAADGLTLMGEPAVPALVEAMTDSRDGVRVRAASALRRIKSHQPIALGALFRALNDPNYLVHQHAYQALDSMGLLDNLIVM